MRAAYANVCLMSPDEGRLTRLWKNPLRRQLDSTALCHCPELELIGVERQEQQAESPARRSAVIPDQYASDASPQDPQRILNPTYAQFPRSQGSNADTASVRPAGGSQGHAKRGFTRVLCSLQKELDFHGLKRKDNLTVLCAVKHACV